MNWIFTPFSSSYGSSLKRIVAVMAEPHDEDPCKPSPWDRDMGKWFTEHAIRDDLAKTEPRFFFNTLAAIREAADQERVQADGPPISWKNDPIRKARMLLSVQPFGRMLDLKDIGGKGKVGKDFHDHVRCNSDKIVQCLLQDGAPTHVIIMGRHAQRAWCTSIASKLAEQGCKLERLFFDSHATDRTGYHVTPSLESHSCKDCAKLLGV